MKPGRALRGDLQLQESAGVGLQPANGAVSGGFCFSLGRGCSKGDSGCSWHAEQTSCCMLRSLKKLFHGEMEDFDQLVASTAAVWFLKG